MEWKNGTKCPVLLTFDIDGKHMWISRAKEGLEGFDKAPHVSTGEYGTKRGVPRILNLLERYDITTGFFIPGIVAEENPEMVKQIDDAGHEIANHSYAHINPAKMSFEEEEEDLIKASDILEDLTGDRPVGYRAPIGDVSENTLDLIIDHEFEYNSSLKGDDVPYLLENEEGSIVELPLHWIGDDATFFNFTMGPEVSYQSGISSPATVYETYRMEFDACYELGLLYNIAFHPQIIGRPYRYKLLEQLIKYIKGHSDVWFAKPIEVARYWREYRPDY